MSTHQVTGDGFSFGPGGCVGEAGKQPVVAWRWGEVGATDLMQRSLDTFDDLSICAATASYLLDTAVGDERREDVARLGRLPNLGDQQRDPIRVGRCGHREAVASARSSVSCDMNVRLWSVASRR